MLDINKVLFVDDEAYILDAGAQALTVAGYDVTTKQSAEDALGYVDREWPGVIISDVKMPGLSGLDFLRKIKHVDPDIPVILITGHGDIAMAVEAMQDGAYDFVEKPFNSKQLLDSVRRSIEKRRLVIENRLLKHKLERQVQEFSILGSSNSINTIREQIMNIADVNADVLIHGETGTGKDLVARTLHDNSSRADNPFVALNCGAIPETIMENELFGHEAGAFTGASNRQMGKIEYANGGTLFLDEIESMPLSLGIKLLRTLQERTIERLGSTKTIPVDIRVIAATKADLKELSAENKFRQDLYYRIAVVEIKIPPLRERKEDISLLFRHFTEKAAKRFNREMPSLPPHVINRLLQHGWPGNVRELQHAADRFVLGLEDDVIPHGESDSLLNDGMTLPEMVSSYEKELIVSYMTRCNGNVKEVYEMLGLPRKTLEDKMRKHGIDRKKYRAPR